MDIYVTYLTIYSGNKLPPFYIGSTSLDKVNNGYRGTVVSKRYKSIWKQELKENPQLFKTKTISYHNTRKEALTKEDSLQRKLNVIQSPMYINLSFAAPDGAFGLKQSGENHPCYGKKYTKERNVQNSIRVKNLWKDETSPYNSLEYKMKKKNQNCSLNYLITFPDGKETVTNNLRSFCRQYNLTRPLMIMVAKGRHNHHKGFKCVYI